MRPTTVEVMVARFSVRPAFVTAIVLSSLASSLTACSSSTPWSRGVPVAQRSTIDPFTGSDRWEVVVCRIPDDVTDPTYATDAERLVLGVDAIIDRLAGVTDYFARWSHQRLRIEWVAGADVAIGSDEDSYDCVDRALDVSDDDVNGVLVIADAQHASEAPGGWGRRGERCERPCPASRTRRAAYVGASDFVSYWGDDSPLDLIEHEIGHAFGWPHSASSAGIGDNHVYDSDVDVMSDSAAPRTVDPTRRHGPGVLAFNAWVAGWLDDEEVVFYSFPKVRAGDWQDAIRLAATDTTPERRAVRLVVVDIGSALLTVEFVADRGDNDHRAEAGVVIHEIVFDEEAPEGRWHVVQPIGADGSLVLGPEREWESIDGGMSIRTGDVRVADEITSIDVRIRRNLPEDEQTSARD